jgi:hypothetical protein
MDVRTENQEQGNAKDIEHASLLSISKARLPISSAFKLHSREPGSFLEK